LFSQLGASRPARTKLILAAAAAALSAGSAVASAESGGLESPRAPRLTDVVCLERCAGLRAAAAGSTVALEGRRLDAVTTVRFTDRQGGWIEVEPLTVGRERVRAEIPEAAESGTPQVVDAYGNEATSPHELEIVAQGEIEPAGAFELREATASPERAFYAGKPKPTVDFVFAGDSPTHVRVDVVHRASGEIVKSTVVEDVAPGIPASATWSGTTGGGKVAENGDYRFEIAPASGGATGGGDQRTSFSQYDHKFPVRGKHTYGDGVGAPRAGHTHQGQDVFADCGARMVAARGGRVQARAYHDAAGYYLVIDGRKTNLDYVYMHLKSDSDLREGERVATGEKIGKVGESGNASGCHLHFELWNGWYEGGSFLHSVTRKLKKWDSWS
jgi:murein DD-endopeptidase MepM/ murein hydrolase activator NlpD